MQTTTADHGITMSMLLQGLTPQEKSISEREHEARSLFPKKRFAAAMPVPTRMLHCALFRVADKRVQSAERISKTFSVSSGGRLEYKGAELRQAEGAVFAYICRLQAGKGLGQWLKLDPKDLIDTLGWAKGTSKSVDRLVACLDRLTDALLRFYDKNNNHMWTTHLVLEWKRSEDGSFHAKLPESLTPEQWDLFSSTTQLNAKLLAKLPEGLTSWLYGFTAGNNGFIDYTIEDLHTYCGSEQSDLKEFTKQVRKALAVLQEAGAIKSFTVQRGVVAYWK